MSMRTYITHGYGVTLPCAMSIDNDGLKRLESLLSYAPALRSEWKKYTEETGIYDKPEDQRSKDDLYSIHEFFNELDCSYANEATLLKLVIQEAENVDFIADSDYDGYNFLLFPPSYPWQLSDGSENRQMTMEKVQKMIEKYVKILFGKNLAELGLTVDFRECENFC